MLLTISTTHQPATDLGYLLYKHPAKVQRFNLAFGQAHVFYPEATPERCTAALLLDINPVDLVRGGNDFALSQYVNDRPYVASSFLSVAIAQVFGTALNGMCKERPELAQTPIPLEAKLSVLPSRGGEALLSRLFAPLGYALNIESHILDSQFPDWGMSPYYTVTLSQTIRLADLLAHLYVLVPVLDDDKHYYVGDAEVEKLLKRGEGWLAAHPERDLIINRYLKHQGTLRRAALARLIEDSPEDPAALDAEEAAVEAQVVAGSERKASLHDRRLEEVLNVLKQSGAQRVLDLGCGEGRLLKLLLRDKQFTQILGMDVSHRALENAVERLRLEQMPDFQRQRVELIHGSLMYRDSRLEGFDAAAVVEVIEHLDPPRLAAFERVLFEFARPGMVVITTPNREYNVMWESLPAGTFRHKDHRFEWARAEFQAWANGIGERFGYTVRFLPVGPEDETVGAPSQMGVFESGVVECLI
ncbi:MAG: 3' terminal RNA ribose 2'-O-methyltransferase Hen1 [Anaerolineaceae bacterium]|nr:3' terminal RNA ribose 2'-O-methyltransferase Hen1 [Anaerolineaceae bacterium]